MKSVNSTNTHKKLDLKESNKRIGSSVKMQSDEYLAPRIYKSKESDEGCSALQLCTAEPTAALQDKILPLEGKPYFTLVVAESHLCRHFIVIPENFLEFLPPSSTSLILSCREKEWVVRCIAYARSKVIRSGWKQFAIDNKLKIGDGCVFELLDDDEMKLRVQILSGEVPAANGDNIENPIVID
ncbi:B3 domain-containing protein [Platanthera zijinensis]|uniref:B3 domain-containing protein n=1 Tax=Platanthera zijinensis TaxID=2320716 RepID=A0AAP0AVE5_9ASPA